MATVCCVVCGENIISAGFEDEARVCPHCGRHLERTNYSPDTESLFESAFNARKQKDYTLAEKIFEQITAFDRHCADAYLGMALSRFAVEPAAEKDGEPKLTEFRRTKFSLDRCYLMAISLSCNEAAADMQTLAKKIDAQIEAMSQKADVTPFDVILCCREASDSKDGVLHTLKEAEALCESLKKLKLKVYMLTSNYDSTNPDAICERFCALSTARVFISCVGSQKEAQSGFFEANIENYKNTSSVDEKDCFTAVLLPFRGKLPSVFADGKVFSAVQPEEKTELAVMVRSYCDKLGRIGETVSLPLSEHLEASSELKAIYEYINNSDFEAAEKAGTSLLEKEPNNISLLWAMLLIKRKVSSVSVLLSSVLPIGYEPLCKKIMSLCTEEVKNRILKIDAAISHNLHLRFLSEARQGNLKQAKTLSVMYMSANGGAKLNSVHSAVLKNMEDGFCPELLGALLLSIASYGELPFSAGAANVSIVADAFSEYSNELFNYILKSYCEMRGSKTEDSTADKLARSICALCEPAEVFEVKYKIHVNASVPLSGDSVFSRYFFVYLRLSEAVSSPDEYQQKVLDFCKKTASISDPQRASLFELPTFEKVQETKKNKANKIKKLRKDASEFISPMQIPATEKKKGTAQVFLGFLLAVLAFPPFCGAVLINVVPDRLLQFSRLWFAVGSISAVMLWGLIVSFVAVKTYLARDNRHHTKFGSFALTVFPSLAVILSAGAVILTIISAATFGARMNVIYLSSYAEFSYIGNYPSGNYVLVDDVDFSGVSPGAIIKFTGNIDGQGHKVSGFYEKSQALVLNNSGNIKNLTFENSIFNGSVIQTNSGNIKDLNFINCDFGRAVVETNKGLVAGNITKGNLKSGCAVKENYGEIRSVTLDGVYLSQDNADVLNVGNTAYCGVLACSNSGFINSCSVNSCTLVISADGVISGGLCGINSGNIGSSSVKNLAVKGKASVFGGLAGRNSGVCSENTAELSDVNLKITRSFGGFAGENSQTLSDCSSKAYGTVTIESSLEERRTVGAFVGYSSGEIMLCNVSGSLNIESNVYGQAALYAGGVSGLQESEMFRVFSDAGINVVQSGTYGETEICVGGLAGKLNNCSVQECERTGSLTTKFNVFDVEQIPEKDRVSSKFQPEYCIGGLAGSVTSDSNNKNETLNDIRLGGVLNIEENGGGSLKFGVFMGSCNCAHVFENSFSLALCTVKSNGKATPEIGIISGKLTDVEKVNSIFFVGRLSVAGANLVPVTFASGKESLCYLCYVKETSGLSSTDITAVPEAIFGSSTFIYTDLGWSNTVWLSKDGRLPVLSYFSSYNADENIDAEGDQTPTDSEETTANNAETATANAEVTTATTETVTANAATVINDAATDSTEATTGSAEITSAGQDASSVSAEQTSEYVSAYTTTVNA